MITSKKKVTFVDVGTTFEEQTLTGFPDRFIILRAKAEIKSGDGTEVAMEIRERSDPDDEDDIALKYEAVETLDYQEQAVVRSYKTRDIDPGKIFVAVRANTGVNNLVVVQLEYVQG